MSDTNGHPEPTAPVRAEIALLGAMLRDRTYQKIPAVLKTVTAEDFTQPKHQAIFRAIIGVMDGSAGFSLDRVLGESPTAGKEILDIWQQSATSGDAEYWSEIVRENGIFNRLRLAGQDIHSRATQQQGSPSEQLADAEKLLWDISQGAIGGKPVPLNEALSAATDRINARCTHGQTGVLTGLVDLDRMLSGFQASELAIIAARPSCGKTAMGVGLAIHAAKNGIPVFLVSLEQSHVELGERILCGESRVSSTLTRGGMVSAMDAHALAAARHNLHSLPITIDDASSQTMTRILSTARAEKIRNKTGLIVLDYLQLVTPENKNERREEQVAGISRRLKHLARELTIPVVAMAQLNRQAEERTPRLSDLRESGSIEADADTVILLSRAADDKGQTATVEITANVAKQRNGPTGDLKLAFFGELLRFDDYLEDPNRSRGSR